MKTFSQLKLVPKKLQPEVWISRLVICKNISLKTIDSIRDIALSRGLNIIWAEESDSDDQIAAITGHSAGKTTFCRLLRYVLGETTFGTKNVMSLIRQTYPDGYVAAEIHVKGQHWAILRPLGSGKMSYLQKDLSVENLLKKKGGAVSQEEYTKRLGLDSLTEELETSQIVQTAEDIKWAHILSWCARDQEARFQNCFEWRSPRSESESPSFRFPKAGPLFLMRVVLGLFLPDELKCEESLAVLQKNKEKLERAIEESRREPQWRLNLYMQQLRNMIKEVWLHDANIDTYPFVSTSLFTKSLENLAKDIITQSETELSSLTETYSALQASVDNYNVELANKRKELEEIKGLFGIDLAASEEMHSDLKERQGQRDQLKKYSEMKCTLGGVLFKDCTHVKQRQQTLSRTELQDEFIMRAQARKREDEAHRLQTTLQKTQIEINLLTTQHKETTERQKELIKSCHKKEAFVRDIKNLIATIPFWITVCNSPNDYEQVALLRKELLEVEFSIAKVEKHLSTLLDNHDKNKELLAKIFSDSVQAVLSSNDYNGQVNLKDRELSFCITHGPAMSGEAMETLAVLLSDVTELIFNTICPESHLPGFLLHDSPREADLGLRIYRNFFRYAASLQEYFGGAEHCPFQYIITTTTAPPEELRGDNFVKLPLNAAVEDKLLLRKNIARKPEQRPDETSFL